MATMFQLSLRVGLLLNGEAHVVMGPQEGPSWDITLIICVININNKIKVFISLCSFFKKIPFPSFCMYASSIFFKKKFLKNIFCVLFFISLLIFPAQLTRFFCFVFSYQAFLVVIQLIGGSVTIFQKEAPLFLPSKAKNPTHIAGCKFAIYILDKEDSYMLN